MGQYLICSITLFVVCLLAQTYVVRSSSVVYCYWGTWSNYRPGEGKFEVSNINPHLCTHIGYAFLGLGDDDQIKSLDSWLDFNLENIAKTVALKQQNSNLKVLASVGGWNEGSTKYSAMAASATRRATFISSAVQFLSQHGFDGLDLDWEYPAQRGGSPSDRSNFVILLRELNTALKARNLLLTIAVAAGEASASISYDIPNLSQHVDLINVMTYDFSGSWDSTTGFNSPLQGPGNNNVKSAINYWLQSGAPASKLVLGIPLYGRSFLLASASQNTPGSPAIGAAPAGPFTAENGFLGYFEICRNIIGGSTRVWDATHMVPYAFRDIYWVGFDDVESIGHKIAYLKSLNLAGAMVWSIETDDFSGACGQNFPLLRAINSGLNIGSPSTTPPGTSTTTTTTTTTTSTSAPNVGNCSQDGLFVNPSDCTRFYQCHHGYRYDFVCPSGLHFDQANGICNWPNLANCS